MKTNYRFTNLSQQEKKLLEHIMLEEMELQVWYAITYLHELETEVLLFLQ